MAFFPAKYSPLRSRPAVAVQVTPSPDSGSSGGRMAARRDAGAAGGGRRIADGGIRTVPAPADPVRARLATVLPPDSPALEARETGSGGPTAPIRMDGADARL